MWHQIKLCGILLDQHSVLSGTFITLKETHVMAYHLMILVGKVILIKRKESATLVDKSIFVRNTTLTFISLIYIRLYTLFWNVRMDNLSKKVPSGTGALKQTRRLQRRSLRLPTRSKSTQTGHLCTTAQVGTDPRHFRM